MPRRFCERWLRRLPRDAALVPLVRFLGATSADVADPVFGKDLSFYLLALPLYDNVAEIIITIVFLMIVLWAVIGLAIRRATTVAVARTPA